MWTQRNNLKLLAQLKWIQEELDSSMTERRRKKKKETQTEEG